MKKRMIWFTAFVIVSVFLCGTALAFNHYMVDVDALKETEKSDTFEVKINRKSISEKTNDDLYIPDTLIFELSNNSSFQISRIVITAVAYDEEGKAQKLDGRLESIGTLGSQEARKLITITSESLSAMPGDTFYIHQPCSYSFSGVRAIVKEYTTSDGQTFTNPCFDAWQEIALGNPTHILD